MLVLVNKMYNIKVETISVWHNLLTIYWPWTIGLM